MLSDTNRLGGQWIDDVSTAWDPFALFYTGGRSIYYPPSVVLIAQTGRYAVAFGTGDRARVTYSNGEEGRFYVFIDDDFVATHPDLPAGGFTEANLMTVFNADDDPTSVTPPLLDTPASGELAGYGIRLTTNERLLARPVTLAGLTFFNTYTSGVVAAGNGCGTTGLSKSYAIFVKNGDGVTPDPDDEDKTVRFREIDGLATQAFVESSATTDDPDPDSDDGKISANVLDARLKAIRDAMREQMPSNCRFTNFTANVRAVRSDTGLEFMAAIPVCFAEGGWIER